MAALKPTIFRKAFLSLLLALLVWLPLFYGLTVPVVNRLAYRLEEQAAMRVLANAVELVEHAHNDIAAWRESALEAHRRELKNVVAVTAAWGRQLQAEAAQGGLGRDEARRRFREGLRSIRYGNGDYLWAADRQSVLVAHPAGNLDQRDISGHRDAQGRLVLPPMVAVALRDGEGYATYRWQRLAGGGETEKLSYFRYLPEWDWVVGSGVYLDDVEAEVARRRTAMVEELRRHLRRVQPGGTGYVFVFDGRKNIVVHPDPRLEGNSMADLKEPETGLPLVELFMAAAERLDRTATYRWNHPRDPDNYTYRKVAWVHYLPEYDWYIGASAYAEDLASSGDFLTGRLLLVFLVGLALTVGGAYFFIRGLSRPLLRLVEVARRQGEGDLEALSDIRRNDEIGLLADAFNAMVHRQREQIALLEESSAAARASEARFRALVEHSLAGIFVIQDGRFRYVNQALADIHGFDDAARLMATCTPADLVTPECREAVLAEMEAVLRGEVPWGERTFEVLRRDGTRRSVQVKGSRVEFGGAPAVIGVVVDVSERVDAERARQQALAAAEELSRLKSEFIANMSHELRTPLNGIIGMAHVGERAAETEKAHNAFRRILDSSHRLLALVTQVLDFSNLESGLTTLNAAPFDLRRFADEFAAVAAPAAAARGLAFDLFLAPGMPAEVVADGERIRQILLILTDNAVKFSDEGGVTVDIGQSANALVFRVADTGVGMAPDTLARLFQPFSQGDGSATRQHGGMGLSLALARRIAIFMAGTLTVESRAGHGSVFTLAVPFRAAPGAAQNPAAPGSDFSI